MSKFEKLYEKALTNPGSVRFSDIDVLLRRYGFACRQPRGGSSHYIYTRGAVQLSIPTHNGAVKPVYVRQAMAALAVAREELERQDEEDGDGDQNEG